MDTNISFYTKTSFWQKIALVIFGIFLILILIETGLRLGGGIILSLQERRNRASIMQRSEYRILCLGESTTQGQYPPFLEEVLNQRNIGIKFSVIDKGIAGTNTWIILSKLESNLEAYHPNMVITMMGINDVGQHMPYEHFSDSSVINFLKSFRTYKLTRLLWLHIVNRLKELKFYSLSNYVTKLKIFPRKIKLQQVYVKKKNALPSKELLRLEKAIEINPGNDGAYVELGRFYRKQGKSSEAEELFKKAIEINPGNNGAYVELVWFYREQGKSSEAEELFKKAIEINPGNDGIYVERGWLYREQSKFSEAEELFKKAIEINPGNDGAYVVLGRLYREQGNFAEAEESFKKALGINPRNGGAYVELVCFYREQGKSSEAEELLKKAIEINPRNDGAYVEQGRLYREQGRFSEAEESFKKAIEINPRNDGAYVERGWLCREQGNLAEAEESFKKAIEFNPRGGMAYVELVWFYRAQGKSSEAKELLKKAIELNPGRDRAYAALEVLCTEMGNMELARQYGKDAGDLRLNYYSLATTSNYRKLGTILEKKGIVYVCVQYPMRKLDPLKKIFQNNDKGIVFVDNEKIWKDAVLKYGYQNYFSDMFAGDFGHCTKKGNRLLAENIANVILKECFKK